MSEPKDLSRSIPWRDDQFLLVNGSPLIYRIGPHDPAATMIVMLPGRERVTLSDLRARGARIQMPVEIRRFA